MPKKVILSLGLDRNNESVLALMGWAHGERHGIRPGFSFVNGKVRENGVYIFSIVPTETIVVPCFLIELDGLYKCVVSFLQPNGKITVSGLKHRNGKSRPRNFIILDGSDVKTIEEEEESKPNNSNLPVYFPLNTPQKDAHASLPQQTSSFIPHGLDVFPDHIPQFVRDLVLAVRSGSKEKELGQAV